MMGRWLWWSVLFIAGGAGAMEPLSEGELAARRGGECYPLTVQFRQGEKCVIVETPSCWDTQTMGDGTCDQGFLTRWLDGENGPQVVGTTLATPGLVDCLVEGPDCWPEQLPVYLTHEVDFWQGQCWEGTPFDVCLKGAVLCARARYWDNPNCAGEGTQINALNCRCLPDKPRGLEALQWPPSE